MRAILIDPTLREVSEVNFDGNLPKILGDGVELVEAVHMGVSHYCWVDEEGLLKPEPGPFFRFIYPDAPMLCGRGLILAMDDEGEHAPCRFPLMMIRTGVEFPAVRFAGFEDSESVQVHPIFGEVNVFSRKAIFE